MRLRSEDGECLFGILGDRDSYGRAYNGCGAQESEFREQ